MATRKAVKNDEETPSAKRPRVDDVEEESNNTNTMLASFDDMSVDVLVIILSYLSLSI